MAHNGPKFVMIEKANGEGHALARRIYVERAGKIKFDYVKTGVINKYIKIRCS